MEKRLAEEETGAREKNGYMTDSEALAREKPKK